MKLTHFYVLVDIHNTYITDLCSMLGSIKSGKISITHPRGFFTKKVTN